jgi:hypothetical protein
MLLLVLGAVYRMYCSWVTDQEHRDVSAWVRAHAAQIERTDAVTGKAMQTLDADQERIRG